MLDEKERGKLTNLFNVLSLNINLTFKEQRWLFEKCEELNQKCKDLQLRIDQLEGRA